MLARPVHPSICLSIHPSGLGYIQPVSLHPPPAWLLSRASIFIPVTYLSLQLSLNCFGSPSESLLERQSGGYGEWKGRINEPVVLDGGVGSELGCHLAAGAALANGCPVGTGCHRRCPGKFSPNCGVVAQIVHGTHGVVTLPGLSSAQGQAGFGGCKDKRKTSPAHVFNQLVISLVTQQKPNAFPSCFIEGLRCRRWRAGRDGVAVGGTGCLQEEALGMGPMG